MKSNLQENALEGEGYNVKHDSQGMVQPAISHSIQMQAQEQHEQQDKAIQLMQGTMEVAAPRQNNTSLLDRSQDTGQ